MGSGGAHNTPAARASRRTAGRKPAKHYGPEDLEVQIKTIAVIGDDPEVERRMKLIKVPAPKNWSEAKTREQTRAEIYKTLVAAGELKKQRADLIPRAFARELAMQTRDLIKDELDKIPSKLMAHLSEFSPDNRAKIEEAVSGLLNEAIDEARKKGISAK